MKFMFGNKEWMIGNQFKKIFPFKILSKNQKSIKIVILKFLKKSLDHKILYKMKQ